MNTRTKNHRYPMSFSRLPEGTQWVPVLLICLLFVATGAGARDLPATAIYQSAILNPPFGDAGDYFGYSVSISGNTVVVGAYQEDSAASGIDGDASDNSAEDSGAAYVFVRQGTNWVQQAYLKASNADAGDFLGYAVAISGDTIVVGAPFEGSDATGVNGDPNNNNLPGSGAAYVFVRDGTNWQQQAYLKASNPGFGDSFGISVTISGDTIAVGAYGEDSRATGVDGDQNDEGAEDSGAAYVFVRNGTDWTQQAYLKASNTGGAAGLDPGDYFGLALRISGDTLVVGAYYEDSDARGVDGGQDNDRAPDSGAAYVFVRDGANWSQQAYLKAANARAYDAFGFGLAISGDTIVVGAYGEGVAPFGSGAAYVFVRRGTTWSQQAYLKASNPGSLDDFGDSVAVSGDTVVVGAAYEPSNATGVNGDEQNNSAPGAGAAYVFQRDGTNWSQRAYLKPPRTDASKQFGWSVAMAADTVVIGGFSGDLAGVANPVGEAHIFSGFGPRLELAPDPVSGFRLRLAGAPETTYALQRASGLDGPWETVATLTTPLSGDIEHHEAALSVSQAFYRAMQQTARRPAGAQP